MATIKEIAKEAGVSIGTVDRVLHNRGSVNAQTKERVLKIARELNYHPNQAAQALAINKKRLKLCMIIMEKEGHPFYKEIWTAAEKKAKELEEFGVTVKFITVMDVHEPVEEDMPNLNEIDGIVVSGEKWLAIEDYMEEARKRDIPIVAYNSWYDENDYLACVGCNYIQSGAIAAGLSSLIGGEAAKIGIFSEGADASDMRLNSYEGRIEGFQLEIENNHPHMEIQDICSFANDQTDNYLKAKELLQKYPEMNIAYVVNPGDYGICEELYRADEKHRLHIITNDLTDNQREMMQKGMISATICQEPEKQGAMPLQILFDYLAYGTLPENKVCYTNLSIHIAQNM